MKDTVRKVGKRRSLVQKLRDPLIDYDGKPDGTKLIEKINAIGEALAYLIDTKDNKGYAEGFAVGLKTGRGITKDLKKRRKGR